MVSLDRSSDHIVFHKIYIQEYIVHIPMKNIRLFRQIFIAVLLIIIPSIFATTWYGTRMIQSFYYQEMERDIGDRALLLRPHILQLLDGPGKQLQEFCRRTGRLAMTRITVINGTGTVLADSNEDPAQMDNHETRPEIRTAMDGTVGASLRFSKTLKQNMLYVAIPLYSDNPQAGVLRLSVAATTINTVLSAIHRKILFGALFIALVAGGLSYFLARRISRPLEEMRRGAERLAGGKTNQPLVMRETNVSKEMAELARSLNHMAEQINKRINIIVQQRNELEAVFTSMTDGVLAIGTDHQIIRINKAAARLFAIDGQDVRNKPFEGVLRNRLLQQFISQALDSKTVAEQDLVLIENGRRITLRTHAEPLYDGAEKRMGSLVIMNNLTRINQLENMRQDFVANVSHELKTPITAIRGYVETLLDGALNQPEEAGQFLRIIARQGARLDAIVDDLLTLARIEDKAEKDAIVLQQEKIRPILEAAVQTCLVQAEQKSIAVDLECPAALEGVVNRPMLEQAVINLLTNAITYSPIEGAVSLQAEQQTSKGRRILRISLQDQGPGIAAEHQERIFERFYRCDKARSREHGGTGLGLAIVKHIAGSHNGTVAVQSTLGRGATFTLVLPGDIR